MPGKKARKNAQPSPPRAPAGRGPTGRGSWPGRGPGPGPGWRSRSGRGQPVCSGPPGLARSAPLRMLSGRLLEGLQGFTQDRGDGEGRDPSLGSGCRGTFTVEESLSFSGFPSALPRGHGEKKVQVRVSAIGRKSLRHGRWGREELLEPPGPPAIPKTGPFLPSGGI